MLPTNWRTWLLVVLASVAPIACAKRQQLHGGNLDSAATEYGAPSQGAVPRRVLAQVYEAYASGDRIYVKALVRNAGSEAITIDRDGWSLRLADGELLGRSSGTTTRHKPYVLQPGESRDVFVDFRKEGTALANQADGATLIVGGVSFGTDFTPHVVGQIQIGNYRSAYPVPPALPMGFPEQQTGAPEREAIAPEPAAPPIAAAPTPTAPSPPAPPQPEPDDPTGCTREAQSRKVRILSDGKDLGTMETGAPKYHLLRCKSRRLEPGLTGDQVAKLLGDPTTTEFGGLTLEWHYATEVHQILVIDLAKAKNGEWTVSRWHWKEP